MGITMHQLLKTLVDQSGTDLHVTTNSPPQIRIDGKMLPLQIPPLGPADTKNLIYSVLTDSQKHRFEENLELDLSFGVKADRFCEVASAVLPRGAVTAINGLELKGAYEVRDAKLKYRPDADDGPTLVFDATVGLRKAEARRNVWLLSWREAADGEPIALDALLESTAAEAASLD